MYYRIIYYGVGISPVDTAYYCSVKCLNDDELVTDDAELVTQNELDEEWAPFGLPWEDKCRTCGRALPLVLQESEAAT